MRCFRSQRVTEPRSIKIFENVSGNQYAQVMSQNISVSLADEFAPFLTPNQYVNFSNGSAAVNKGAELAASAADEIGVVTNVYNYVINNITYDTAKAASVQSGYLRMWTGAGSENRHML